MTNLNINSAKAAIEAHKIEQEKIKVTEENKKREILRDIKNDEYNQKAIKIAEDCKILSVISLVVAVVAVVISIFK